MLQPEESRTFPFGCFDFYRVGKRQIGRAKMAEGRELTIGPVGLFSIPSAHDSGVIGDEVYVSLHLLGVSDYAALCAGDGGAAEKAGRVELAGRRNTQTFPLEGGVRGLDASVPPRRQVILERTPPASCELAHVHRETRQFCFGLGRQAPIAVDAQEVVAGSGEGVEIAPGSAHEMGRTGMILSGSSRPHPRHDEMTALNLPETVNFGSPQVA
jgi:hypothetical protein